MAVRLRAGALLLDFNGTLSDDEQVLYDVYAAMLAVRGRTLPRREYFGELLGSSDAEIFRRTLGEAADVDALTAERITRYRFATAAGTTVSDERRDAVRFASAWVPVAVVTSAWRAEVTPVLEASDVARLLTGAVCADDVERHKPAPDAYLAALELVGVEPERAIAVEDSETGMAAARAAGIRCVSPDALTPRSVAALLLG